MTKSNGDGPSPRPPLFGFGETAMLAYATGVTYLVTGAYQLGYQNYFGFTYLNIGVGDLISAFRRLDAVLRKEFFDI
jgi:hypothetical protein